MESHESTFCSHTYLVYSPTSSIGMFDQQQQQQRQLQIVSVESLNLQCERCGKSYSLKHNLQRHVKFECGGQRKFCCHLCPNKYTQNASLHRHLLHHHYVDPRKAKKKKC
ncbi:hypothetical protein TSAR_012276 [Trichomalopsis sarcophagae]|uniref:C2H2-type domain-containing protein n=1 Tax=Trichomalopsis sarcophagae TaxID=543379 RepID=A0A232FP60_9HYME|nr:hypothetical protein TSAR_012276 [Trichomalopsis sarcophagae]